MTNIVNSLYDESKTDLSTDNLERLFREGGEELKKAAVDITRELILLRIALHDDIDIWQHVSTDKERTTVEQNLAAKVVKDINESLGDYDD